jgi:hypothetical protein
MVMKNICRTHGKDGRAYEVRLPLNLKAFYLLVFAGCKTVTRGDMLISSCWSEVAWMGTCGADPPLQRPT